MEQLVKKYNVKILPQKDIVNLIIFSTGGKYACCPLVLVLVAGMCAFLPLLSSCFCLSLFDIETDQSLLLATGKIHFKVTLCGGKA